MWLSCDCIAREGCGCHVTIAREGCGCHVTIAREGCGCHVPVLLGRGVVVM